MRKTFNLKNTPAVAMWLLLLMATIHSCRRQDGIIQSNPVNKEEAKAWLQKNGLAYKNETISVQGINGQIFNGKLNWQKAKQYNWRGRSYVDVPFEFNANRLIPGNNNIAPASFNMVIRRKGMNDFEGAVRTVMHGVATEVIQTGEKSYTNLQSYQSISGENINIWRSDLGSGKFFAAKNTPITRNELLQMRKNITLDSKGTVARSVGDGPMEECQVTVSIYYKYGCFGDPDADIHDIVPITCYSYPSDAVINRICYKPPIPGGHPPIPTGPGGVPDGSGGGGGGTPGSSPGVGTECPDVEEQQPPVNPDDPEVYYYPPECEEYIPPMPNISITEVPPGPLAPSLGLGEWGVTSLEGLKIELGAHNNGTVWSGVFLGLVQEYSMQVRLLPGVQEVTSSNSTPTNYCTQVLNLSFGTRGGIGYPEWGKIVAVQAHENVHRSRILPILVELAPEIGTEIRKLMVANTGQTVEQAIADLKLLPAWENISFNAKNNTTLRYLETQKNDHAYGGQCDIAEDAITRPVRVGICNKGQTNGWPVCSTCQLP